MDDLRVSQRSRDQSAVDYPAITEPIRVRQQNDFCLLLHDFLALLDLTIADIVLGPSD